MGTNHSALTAGSVTPSSDEALGLAGAEGFRDQGTQEYATHYRKRAETALARAALVGIEARLLDSGAWRLRHAQGADIGIVQGLTALEAAVQGFEAARDDVQALVRRMRGAV